MRALHQDSTGEALALRRRSAAFSLVEITLALAVFALAIVALLSLLPNAFGTAQRSRAETRATQIARSVFSDLRATPFGAARLACPNGDKDFLAIDLATSQTKDIIYGSEGRPTSEASGTNGSYASGAKGNPYLIRLEATPEASPPAGATPRYATVILSVEFPGGAPAGNRTKLKISTLVSR